MNALPLRSAESLTSRDFVSFDIGGLRLGSSPEGGNRRAGLAVGILATAVLAGVAIWLRPETGVDGPPPDTGLATVTPPTETQPFPVSTVWSADHETGDMSQWPGATLGWDDPGCTYHGVSSDYARSGSYSLKLTIDIPAGGKAGCRQARTEETQAGNTYVYEVSYLLPQPVLTLTGHWNVFQFKSKCATCSNSDPIWTIDFQGDPLRPVLQWKGSAHGIAGPREGDGVTGQIEYPNILSTVPIGSWTTLTVYLHQSSDYDGRIIVWQDGLKLYEISGIRTEYPTGDSRWSVNNYSNGLTVNPYTLYLDDASISVP